MGNDEEMKELREYVPTKKIRVLSFFGRIKFYLQIINSLCFRFEMNMNTTAHENNTTNKL